MKDLAKLSVTAASLAFREGTLKPSQLTEAYLGAIASQNAGMNAYLEVYADDAHSEARAADERFAQGAALGPLDGIPIAVKDNILISGKRTTAGSKILEPYVASYDATVIARLKKAGVVFLGKTNLDEFAMGSSTEHSAFGPTRNPHDPLRVPGGSSGGSAAAVAANLCSAALGSDTGGSIRQPAAFCGIVGMKPTYGRVSRSGLIAMASSLDQIGPMAKSVEDAELLFSHIAGHDPLDATTYPADGRWQIANSKKSEAIRHTPYAMSQLRVGLPKEYFGEGLDDRLRAAVMDASEHLKEKGASITEVSLPYASYALAVYYLIMPSEVSANLARFDGIRYGASMLRMDADQRGQDADRRGKSLRDSAFSLHQSAPKDFWDVYFETRREYFGEETKRRVILGTFALSAGYYDAYYVKAQKVRELIKTDFKRVFNEVDVLLTPTTPTPPFRLGERTQEPLQMYLADIYTVPGNIAGIPGLVVPFGSLSEQGSTLPIGVQLMGPNFSEPLLFEVGKVLEAVNREKSGAV